MANNGGSEVITLQFGHYSNFVGTHWWNCQEASFDYNPDVVCDINYDALFREGQNHRREVTFTPRMLLVDLKGSLGHLTNDLYEDPYSEDNLDIYNTVSTWPPDKVEVVKSGNQSTDERNEFQEDIKKLEINDNEKLSHEINTKNYDFDCNVKLWSDYVRTRYHPRSINLLEEYQYGNSAQPFDCYLQGTEIWKNKTMNEYWTDKLRHYIEECDCLQGFQILSDATDGFSGICSSSLQYIKDEYSSKTCFVFPVIPPRDSESNYKLRNVNSALLISTLSELSDMFSPLSITESCWSQNETYKQFPHVQYNPTLPYHSSSLLASLLDTASLSYRLRGSSGLRMNDLSTLLTPVGRKAISSSLTLPWAMNHGQSLLECLEHWEGPLSYSLTPYSKLENVMLQNMNLKGVDKNKLFPKNVHNKDRSSNPAYNCSSVRDMLQYFLSCDVPRVAHYVYTSSQPMKTVNPFPNIFSKEISSHGCLQDGCLDEFNQRVDHVPTLGGLHCCESSGTMLSALYEEVQRINVKSIPSLISLDKTEYAETLESIISLSDEYNENSMI